MVPFSPHAHSSRDHFVEPPDVIERCFDALPPSFRSTANFLRVQGTSIATNCQREWRRKKKAGGVLGILRQLICLRNALIMLWGFTLWWGERTVFRDAVMECDWGTWEKWPENTVPHHVVFIADPQLVDAHTYPGRIWPLSSLTIFYADLYLYRTYSLLRANLQPDSTFFLGDLFDGGREWGTSSSSSPDLRYKNYGHKVWLKEYRRFAKIFFEKGRSDGKLSPSSSARGKFLATIPGNHDLGFGNGIQKPVVDRFKSFFGESNRVDILGNHSFVSIDSVSLSAMDQPDPKTGATNSEANEHIWKPTEEFLDRFQNIRGQAVREELLMLNGQDEKYRSPHAVEDATGPSRPKVTPMPDTADFPNIILTHVPLYRAPRTPCGPLRERYPPSSTDPLPEEDEKNAIPILKGYQYQNVLTPTISNNIINKAGPVTQIYSGDDHDYCEIIHREFNGAPKEITVKSMSLAMGIRRPGFQMASLWNPIDPKTGNSINPQGSSQSQTLQNHLCLLPDQFSIFVQYGYVLFLTVILIFIRAVSLAFRHHPSHSGDSDPIFHLNSHQQHSSEKHSHYDLPISSSSSTATSASPVSLHRNTISATAGTTHAVSRASSNSPSSEGKRVKHVRILGVSGVSDGSSSPTNSHTHNGYGFRRSESGSPESIKFKDGRFSTDIEAAAYPRRGIRRSIRIFHDEFVYPLKWVSGVAFGWYLWLIWTW